MTEQEARAEERLVSAEVLDEYRKVVEWLERTAAVLGPAGDTMHGLAAEALSRLIEREQHRHRIPLYAMLDLWMALYQTSHPEFDEFYAEHGYAETWARLCAEVRARLSSRVVVAAPSDTDRDFKRIPAETRAELIHMAEGRIKDVWADSPEGVDAATLASNVVAAQEFVWMQLAAGVDLRASQPVQAKPLWETKPDGRIGPTEHGLKVWNASQPVQVEVTTGEVEHAAVPGGESNDA